LATILIVLTWLMVMVRIVTMLYNNYREFGEPPVYRERSLKKKCGKGTHEGYRRFITRRTRQLKKKNSEVTKRENE